MPGTRVSHAEQVQEIVRYGPARAKAPLGNDERLFQSWKRSLEAYRLDPGRAAEPRILTSDVLRDHQGAMERFLRIARHGVRQLHSQVRDANYVVLLTNGEGVTIDFSGDSVWDRDLKRAGLYLGSCWSEREEGTCGVGTAIIDGSPITVHKGEHFRSPNTTLTCSAAPVMDAEGKLLAILDASALYSPDDKKSQALVLQFVRQYALMIEDAYFLDVHRGVWVVQMASSREFLKVQTECLLAVDEGGRVVAANRRAKAEIAQLASLPRPLESLFGLTLDALDQAAASGIVLPMRDLHGARPYFAHVRAPIGRADRAGPGTGARPRRAVARIAGTDPQMAANAARAARILDAPIPVLLLGETGTGKETFARALHADSDRAGKPFVAVNCAAVAESLIEAELFDHDDGVTAAESAGHGRGRVLQADGGILFLDEVGDMPLPLQARLLRVLAEGEMHSPDQTRSVKIDLRVICATHRDLGAMVAAGQFRADLYYRLAGAVFHLPALKERRDAAALVTAILDEEAAAQGRTLRIEAPVVDVLLQRPWPGNLRELRIALRYAVTQCDGDSVRLHDLPPTAGLSPGADGDLCGFAAAAHAIGEAFAPPAHLDDERERIIAALRRHAWRAALAARELGLSRATLYRRIKALSIVSPNLLAARDEDAT